MTNPDIVLVETVVDAALEKFPEVAQVVEQVEEIIAKKSCSCFIFGWNIVATKAVQSPPKSEPVSNTGSKE